MRSGYVYVENIRAGILQETDDGDYIFSYFQEYLVNKSNLPVSLTLPLQSEEFLSKTLFSFFDGLIPEGWLLDLSLRNWKLQANDRMGLLLKCCNDSIGNVSIKEISNE